MDLGAEIAKYGVCVVTNKANPVGNLTSSQLAGIFTGKTRSWSGLPGASQSGTIDLISRTSVAVFLFTLPSRIDRRFLSRPTTWIV